MREIKFKAWDKEERKMYPVYSLCSERQIEVRKGMAVVSLFNLKKYSPPQFELMQYTGLKDKNGTEIYEGDIVRHNLGKEEVVAVVHFMDGAFVARYLCSDYDPPYDEDTLEGSNLFTEVIGNIYENKELLNEDKTEKS